MLLLRLFMTGAEAEKAAVAIAPLLPMGVAMASLALVCRRLIAPQAYIVGLLLLLAAHSAKGMWMPLRIDHHGWQLAMLRSEEHTSELQSLMRISYAVFCLTKKNQSLKQT